MSKDQTYLIKLMQGDDFPLMPLKSTAFRCQNYYLLYSIIVKAKTRECAEIYKHILSHHPDKKQELLSLLMDITRELDRRLVHEKNIDTGDMHE